MIKCSERLPLLLPRKRRGKAAPPPPVGPASRRQVHMDFCKEYQCKDGPLSGRSPSTQACRCPPSLWFNLNLRLRHQDAGRLLLVKKGRETGDHWKFAEIKAADEHMKHIPVESVITPINL
ncbi:hypothetical protein C8J57DRAFT_1500039 [Mycena rebaudengoi]|nr:hypothetical protein C8J57DRAFT_1500039 [Mycena rebaudengoi]